MKTTYIVIIAIAICTIIFHLAAKAGEREDHQTINNIIHNHDREDTAKGIAIGVIATCGIRSLYYGIKDKRWTWCGEPRPEPDLPKPGPVVNDLPLN